MNSRNLVFGLGVWFRLSVCGLNVRGGGVWFRLTFPTRTSRVHTRHGDLYIVAAGVTPPFGVHIVLP